MEDCCWPGIDDEFCHELRLSTKSSVLIAGDSPMNASWERKWTSSFGTGNTVASTQSYSSRGNNAVPFVISSSRLSSNMSDWDKDRGCVS
jgi:hypothetical protein